MTRPRRLSWFRVATVLAAGLVTLSGCGAPRPSAGVDRAVRDHAAARGLSWLAEYLADEDRAAVLGWDAVQIFLEPGWTSADPGQRALGQRGARLQGRRLAERLRARGDKLSHGELLDLLELAVEAERLELERDRLTTHAAATLDALPDPDVIYGWGAILARKLEEAWEGDFLALLLGVYHVERARVAGVWSGPGLRLADVLAFLRGRSLLTREEDRSRDKVQYRDHVYLVTHVAYVLCDYGRIRLRREDEPWVYEYLDRVFPDLLAAADVELVAEVVDVWRCLGRDEAQHGPMRAGTRFLLDAQRADGSWGSWEAEEDPYQAAHRTWCATNALRERRFLSDTPWQHHLPGLLQERPASGRVR